MMTVKEAGRTLCDQFSPDHSIHVSSRTYWSRRAGEGEKTDWTVTIHAPLFEGDTYRVVVG